MAVSIDLTTLPGYATLQGNKTYKISCKAMATGFRDSNMSETVDYVVPEIWLLNEIIDDAVRIYYDPKDFTGDFGTEIVNGSGEYWTTNFANQDQSYNAIGYDRSSDAQPGAADSAILVYSVVETTGAQPSTWWVDDTYRTIVFDNPVTDETLFAWLEANGTRQ